MSDLASTPPTTASNPNAAPNPQPSLGDSLNTVLKTAPELGTSPGLAVGVAQSGGDTQTRAQAVARGANAISDSTAKDRVSQAVGGGNVVSKALDWFGNSVAHVASSVASPIEHDATAVVGDVGKTLNAPLAAVQHEYRYLHDVEARHGYLAATLEGIGIAAGAAAGFAGGGVQGAVLGGESTAALEGQFFYTDSWDRTSSGSYTDPHTHQSVSIGRDVASVLGLRPGTTTYKVGSGIIDGIADMGLDPVAQGGMALGKAKSAEGAAGKLGEYFGGIAPVNAEDVDRVYNQYPSVRRAFSDIASKDAGQIIATPAYSGLRQIALQLGRANSADDVAQVFKDVFRTQELAFSDKLPTLAFTRIPMQAAREAIENAPTSTGPVSRLLNPANMAQRLTRLPESFDSAAKAISGSEFDPSDPVDNGALGLYRMLRFSETRSVAASVVKEYLDAPDLGSKIQVYRNATLNSLFSMARMRGMSEAEYLEPMAPEDRHAMKEALDNFTGGGAVGQAGDYGRDDQGRALSLVKDTSEGNRQYASAITDNQTGKLKFIPLNDMRRAAATLRNSRDLFGRADDFAYRHVTQGLFKPLVLLTPSYAEHISLAELIPNMLREGVRNVVKSGVAINATKLGLRAKDDELGAISGVAWRLIGGTRMGRSIEDGIGALDPAQLSNFGKRVQLASRYVEYNDGHFQALGLSSGHNYSNEVNKVERSASLLRHAFNDSGAKTGDGFAPFANGSQGYADSWQSWLRELSGDTKTQLAAQRLRSSLKAGKTLDEATQDASAAVSSWLHDQPDSYLGKYTRSKPTISSLAADRPDGMDSLDDWAHVVVQNLRGATRGMHNGPLHDNLLEHIANGEHVDATTLDAIPDAERPLIVKGREIVPDGNSKVQAIANKGFTKILNPMVNFLSRQPIAFEEFEKQYARLAPSIENGIMDDDEAMSKAMERTVNSVIRNVHNLHDRTQWTVTMRNWAPFYFAQEQAYRRMGRMLAENPGAFRRYQLMISNIHDVGNVLGGQNGQGYFVVPGTGFLTSGVASTLSRIGLPIEGSSPVGMGWNLNSTSVIFPLSSGARPDLGPVAAVPIQAITQLFPEFGAPALKADVTAAEQTVLGSSASSGPIWEQLIPNVIAQRLIEAANGGQYLPDRSFDSAMMNVLQTLDYEKKIPPANAGYQEMQTFLNRVRNQTRIMYAMKAIVGATTPVSPELQVKDFGFPAKLTADITKAGSVSKGITEFLSQNPDATPFTVFQSGNPTGASIPASVEAEKWINSNSKIIHDYPNAALFLMPQLTDTKYNSTIYNEQLAQGLRSKYAPGTINPDGTLSGYMAQLYIAAGNATVLDNWYPQYKKQLVGLTGSEKYTAEQNWQASLASFATQNPVWGAWWNSDTKATDRAQAITQLQSMFSKGEAPASPQTTALKGLLSDYQTYQNQLAAGRQDAFAVQSQSSITANWENYLESIVQSNPQLSTAVNGLFMSLPASTTGTANA